mmetsp:Transcript_66365/g.154216  ORF Transcript_66365/g.154216 Transcript_66365/m.154216 type:complete len:271 (+) Transcript_66365:75-887(+)
MDENETSMEAPLMRSEVVKAAAGAHSKTKVVQKSRSFMSVPDHLHGYMDLHEQDEGDMEGAFNEAGTSPLTSAKRLVQMELEGPLGPSVEEAIGNYEVRCSDGCCAKQYCVLGFNVEEGDIVPASEMKEHLTGCCGAPAHALGSKVKMHILLKKKKVRFARTMLAKLIKRIAGDVVYVFTVSENGIVRFHLPPETGTLTKLAFAYADSESFCGFFSNIKHAMTNGCFCLGVFYKEKQGETAGTEPRLVLMRFNRWKKNLAPFWAGICSKA